MNKIEQMIDTSVTLVSRILKQFLALELIYFKTILIFEKIDLVGNSISCMRNPKEQAFQLDHRFL